MIEQEGENKKEIYQKELMRNPKTEILVVCMHGRSRSKAIARMLRNKFRYPNAGALGIRDSKIPINEKKAQLEKAQLVVYVESDVLGEITHLYEGIEEIKTLGMKLVNFPLTQLEHHVLSSDPGMRFKKDEVLPQIEGRLALRGFEYQHEQ